MPGPKRRKAIAILIFLQAILFGVTTPIGNYSLLQFIARDPTFVGVSGPGWQLNQSELNFDQVFGLAVAIIVAVLVWRGLPFAVYSTAALAALGALYGVIYTIAEFMIVGPRALSFLFFFPLPTVPPTAIAVPVLLLALAVIVHNRSVARQPARETLPAS
jgi:hypothetical protein